MVKRYLPAVLRILLGLLLIAANLAALFLGTKPPPEYPAAATAFMLAMQHTGYLQWLVQGVEVLAGLALLVNLWVPLALVVLAPVSVNILLLHVFLTPGLLFTIALPGVLVFVLNAVLLWLYRDHYGELLVPRRAR